MERKKVLLCQNFASLVKITNDFFYYIDNLKNLIMIRSDGIDYHQIAKGISVDNVIVDKEYIIWEKK